jgi:hypothetical protein
LHGYSDRIEVEEKDVGTNRWVNTDFWNNPRVRQLDTFKKAYLLFFITAPTGHLSGMFAAPIAIQAGFMGVSSHEIVDGLAALENSGFILWDSEQEVVWVKEMLDHQGKGAKVWETVAKQLNSLRRSKLVRDFLERYKHLPIPHDEETKQSEPSIGYRSPTDGLTNSIPDPLPDPVSVSSSGSESNSQKLKHEATSFPDDFSLDEELASYAAERSLHARVELNKFRDHARSKNRTSSNWRNAWRAWCLKAVEFGHQVTITGNNVYVVRTFWTN